MCVCVLYLFRSGPSKTSAVGGITTSVICEYSKTQITDRIVLKVISIYCAVDGIASLKLFVFNLQGCPDLSVVLHDRPKLFVMLAEVCL